MIHRPVESSIITSAIIVYITALLHICICCTVLVYRSMCPTVYLNSTAPWSYCTTITSYLSCWELTQIQQLSSETASNNSKMSWKLKKYKSCLTWKVISDVLPGEPWKICPFSPLTGYSSLGRTLNSKKRLKYCKSLYRNVCAGGRSISGRLQVRDDAAV